MKTHKPIFITLEDGKTEYIKNEMDDHFLFRKTKSISINASNLEKSDVITINLIHRKVKVSATKEQIKQHRDVKTFNGEVKYYLPIDRWSVIAGDVEWHKAL